MRAVQPVRNVLSTRTVQAGLRLGLALTAITLTAFAEGLLVRIPESEARKAAIAKPDPSYPPMARQLHITGRAQLDAFVDTEGNVEKVTPVSGNPILTAASSEALKKWKFTPFTASGKPTRAVTGIAFEFK